MSASPWRPYTIELRIAYLSCQTLKSLLLVLCSTEQVSRLAAPSKDHTHTTVYPSWKLETWTVKDSAGRSAVMEKRVGRLVYQEQDNYYAENFEFERLGS